ncbi:MAG: stage II sporulation protein R [Oscillospiraceae bacterium]|nr:stage II sporulation protein R [Oscillospiraceae bacterium]
MFKDKLRIWEAAVLVALSVALCTGTWAQGRQDALSGKLVRLHVLAHSDDDSEQQIKLDVRNAVLAYLEPILETAADSRGAEALIMENMDGIAGAARKASQGRAVSVSLSTERYPTRQYEDLALPAGEYRSLRVTLGAGEGQNWWCVVFPPLCTQTVLAESAYPAISSEDIALMKQENGYRLAFRSMELWSGLKAFFENN